MELPSFLELVVHLGKPAPPVEKACGLSTVSCLSASCSVTRGHRTQIVRKGVIQAEGVFSFSLLFSRDEGH